MRPSDRDLQSLGPFPGGANNLARETEVPRTQLREAVNVDLSDRGTVRRRRGYTKLDDLNDASSVIGYGRRGFVLDGDELLAFEVLDRALSGFIPIAFGLRPGRLAHTLIEPDIFVSDGVQNLRITPDNRVSPWTPPVLPEPTVSSLPGGGMDAGGYQLVITAKVASGEEGPPSEPVSFTLDGNSVVEVVLPRPPESVARVAIYMTKPNGRELLLVGTVPAGTETATITNPRLGRPLATDFMQALPPARHALYFRSRLWVADGAVLTASEPFQYGVTQYDFNTMALSERITGLAAAGEAGGGFFVGQQSKVYFAQGDTPNELRLSEKYPAGMVEGTLQMVPGAKLPFDPPPTEPVPVWLATNGVVCVGLASGEVAPLSEGRYAAAVGETGAATFVQRGGESRYIATTQAPDENIFAATDEVSYEVVRNGIVLHQT